MDACRRRFLGLATLTVGAAVVAGDLASRYAGGPGIADLAQVLGEPDSWSARRIGEAWLRAHPEEADRAVLEGLLAPLPEAVRRANSLRDRAVLDWLRDRQRADFAEGRIARLEGWWLSLTEVRYCALLFLA